MRTFYLSNKQRQPGCVGCISTLTSFGFIIGAHTLYAMIYMYCHMYEWQHDTDGEFVLSLRKNVTDNCL